MALHSQDVSSLGDLPGIALCAGVGGLELGLHLAEPGYRTVCYVERDAFAAATLVARMADKALDDAPIWSDLRTFDGRPWLGKVRLISAGYPCQPFSTAGKRRGKHDPRHLWPEVARIVREVQPEWVFCENVEGHLDLGLSEVIQEFRRMGFSPKAGLFSAAEVGAWHLRRRIFILAHSDAFPLLVPNGDQDIGGGVGPAAIDRPTGSAAGRGQRRPSAFHAADTDKADWDTAESDDELPLFAPSPSDLGAWQQILDQRLDLQPELFGLADGMAYRVERPILAGNGVVPLAAARAWKALVQLYA